jgi:lysine biosynthesis protein LysW
MNRVLYEVGAPERNERSKMPKTRCPNCDTAIKIEKPREGAVITCPGCGVELEVITADPLEVDFTDDWQNEWEE